MATPYSRSSPTRADFAALLGLAAPIVVVQIGLMLMGVVDTVMVGNVSATALASVALGAFYFFVVSVSGMGVLYALDPIISQALGAKDSLAVARGLQRGLVLAAALSVLGALALFTVEPVLAFARQPIEVVPGAASYVHRLVPGVLPFYAFIVLRQTLQAHRRTAPMVITIVLANLLNAGLNYAWIYGHFGFPALGIDGSAWATTVSRWFMALALFALGWRDLAPYLRRAAPNVLEARPLARMIMLGLPIGAQLMLEVGVFSGMSLVMGWLGVIEMAAHQVALNMASLTFMVPLGVGSAAAVMVGHAVGRGDAAAVRRSTYAALSVGAGFMSLTAVLLIGVPESLARLYGDDPRVLELAATLLPIAGVFQVFDGLQVVAIGLLRGLGDTRVPMLANMVGYWLVGMPVSLWLGFGAGLGAPGLWWGLVVGLVTVALFMLRRLRERERRDLARLAIDDRPTAASAP